MKHVIGLIYRNASFTEILFSIQVSYIKHKLPFYHSETQKENWITRITFKSLKNLQLKKEISNSIALRYQVNSKHLITSTHL